MKVKVLHYIPGFDTGGIESRLVDWYRNIDRNKIEFVVITMNTKESEKAKEFIDLGGRFCIVPKLTLKTIFKFFKSLNKIIKDENPNIVHVHCMNSGLFCLIIAKKNKIKTRIFHSRTTGFLPNEKNIFIKRIIKKITPYFATDYFACSYEAGLWGNGKKNKDRTIVIPNGIELPLFIFNNKIRSKIRKDLNLEDKYIIGTIGRLSSQKNLLYLIEIFDRLLKTNTNNKDYHLVLVGNGPMESELLEKVKTMSIEKNVTFLPSKLNVWDYYMAFDLFISTSYYEGFGTTAVESQATGLPTILSTGFPKVVELSDFVRRIPLTNNIESWVEEIKSVNPHKRSKADADNIEKKGYSARAVAKKLEAFYIDNAVK